MKRAFYIATIINSLLWGCESLNIRKEDHCRLKVFHHSTIRCTCNILQRQQAITRLSNVRRLRKKCGGIANMQERSS
jgi:hypothetical protein